MSEKGVSVAHTLEFRTEAVRLYRIGGRGIKVTARQIGVAPGTLCKWVHQAQIDEGVEEGLTSEERADLWRLRREVRSEDPRRGEGDPPQGSAFLRPGDRSSAMRFRLIDEEKSRHSISRMARVLGVTAADFHAWKRRAPSPYPAPLILEATMTTCSS